MPVSPLVAADGPVAVAVLVDGIVLPATAALISVTVRLAVNGLPSATLVLADGDLASGTFSLADGDTLKPGVSVTLKAGYGTHDATIFTGRVVSRRLAIQGDNESRLMIECRDRADVLAGDRRSALYRDHNDADIAATRVAAHGLTADITGMACHHEQLVQQDCSDWDFLLARARANGCVVTVSDGRLMLAEPPTTGSAALKVSLGEDMVSFDAQSVAAPPGGPALPVPLSTSGRVSFQGSAMARPGELIELSGVGRSFSGERLITGITHRLAAGEWNTEVEFGPPWLAADAPPALPRASVTGLHVGRVLRLEGDPAAMRRILVQVPAFGDGGLWAPLLQFKASKDAGAFFVPEVDDEVLIGFLADDPGRPVVVGSFYSREHPPAAALNAANPPQGFVTRAGTRLAFDDADGAVTVATPDGRTLVLSDREGSVTLSDDAGNRIALTPAGIHLQSPTDVRIEAGGDVAISARGALTLAATGSTTVSGLNVRCEAQIGLTARGVASAELSATGQTTVKGSLVMIN